MTLADLSSGSGTCSCKLGSFLVDIYSHKQLRLIYVLSSLAIATESETI
jgi:hypothetical protein